MVPEEAYTYYANLKRPPTEDYSVYVTDPADNPFIFISTFSLEGIKFSSNNPARKTVAIHSASFISVFLRGTFFI